eukprot:9486624-Pyramimonas_sp.AAC.1
MLRALCRRARRRHGCQRPRREAERRTRCTLQGRNLTPSPGNTRPDPSPSRARTASETRAMPPGSKPSKSVP